MKEDKKYRFGSARKTAEKMKSGFDSTTLVLPEGVKQFKIKSDKTVRIDIIPFLAGKGNPNADEGVPYWERTFYTHRNVGPNNEQVVCLARSLGKKCPVCEMQAKMQRDESADENTIKGMYPKQRQLFCVIDLNNPDEGIQIWDISFHLFGKLLAKRITDSEDGEGWDNFYHPTKGSTLKLGINEKSFDGNTFYEVVSIDLVPRKKQYKLSIVEEAPCLDDVVKALDYDDLKEKIQGVEEDEEDEDESKKKKKARFDEEVESDDDEDEDEDDGESDDDRDIDETDEDEEEDEEEEVRKPKKKAKHQEEDEEDEDEEDDDSDEDESDDEEDSDDDEEDEEDEDEEDESDDDEEDDEEEEFERELPRKRKH